MLEKLYLSNHAGDPYWYSKKKPQLETATLVFSMVKATIGITLTWTSQNSMYAVKLSWDDHFYGSRMTRE
jgi:hypothetical protein